MKKIVFGFVFAFFAAFGLSAQQITRFGVVDTARVYQAYFRNSAPVRNYESKKAEFQTEINKRTEEIQNLKNQKVDFQKNNNSAAVSRLDAEITRKTSSLNRSKKIFRIQILFTKNFMVFWKELRKMKAIR